MNVCYTVYDASAVVSMASLLNVEKKMGHPDIAFFVFVDRGGESFFEKMVVLAKQYGANICQLPLDGVYSFCISHGFPPWHGFYLNYARVFLPLLCPTIERIIYLDGDTMILRAIDDLWKFDLGKKSIGGVHDSFFSIPENYRKYEHGGKAGSINDGILLLDLSQLRKEGFNDKITRFGPQNIEAFTDQDLFNLNFADSIAYLPPCFNFHSRLRFLSYRQYKKDFGTYRLYSHQEFRESKKHPVIVHFNGSYFDRPWYRLNYSFYSHKWRKYYENVFGFRPQLTLIPNQTVKNKFARLVKLLLSRILPGPYFYSIVVKHH